MTKPAPLPLELHAEDYPGFEHLFWMHGRNEQGTHTIWWATSDDGDVTEGEVVEADLSERQAVRLVQCHNSAVVARTGERACERLKTVWLVGGRKGDAFADVYAHEEDAIAEIIRYIFDPHWFEKLPKVKQRILRTLKETPDLAIEYYNEVAAPEDKWVIVESVVLYGGPDK